MLRILLIIAAILTATAALASTGCAATHTNRDPTGEAFPVVSGQSLEEEAVELPSTYAGEPVVLLVGYQQRSQFDIDRWIMGLLQADLQATIVEVPTIPGLMPTLASKWIDDGMRAGIPQEDWGAVVTLYGKSAKPVAEFTGTQHGQRARVLVLDGEGVVVWFSDRGYSATQAMDVAELVIELNENAAVSE